MLILLVVLAQAPAPPLPTTVKVSFEQAKPELERPTINLAHPIPDKPLFRVEIRERAPLLEPLWKETNGVPAYVHTPRPPVHHDFLAMVTPEEFRSATLYPCCIDVVPLLDYLQDYAKQAIRSQRESQAKRTVYESLWKAGFSLKKD